MATERARRETFAGLVHEQTIALGGFNYWETSAIADTQEGYFHIYSGYVLNYRDNRRGIHIVIGEKGHGEAWYFGAFRGPHWNDMTAEEGLKYYERELEFLKDKFRVQGGQLESLIREVVYFLP